MSFRVDPRVKDVLVAAAKRERRSLANMLEVMVLGYCEARGIDVPEPALQTSASNSQK